MEKLQYLLKLIINVCFLGETSISEALEEETETENKTKPDRYRSYY